MLIIWQIGLGLVAYSFFGVNWSGLSVCWRIPFHDDSLTRFGNSVLAATSAGTVDEVGLRFHVGLRSAWTFP